jgi:thioredoxin reductase (NADPH)
VIASGAQYNKPEHRQPEKVRRPGCLLRRDLSGSAVVRDDEVIVVGGGNSAGQAAVYLSQTASKVHILVRAQQLSETMSRYLIQRIDENPAIEMHYRTEIVGIDGDSQLERVTWRDKEPARLRRMTSGTSSSWRELLRAPSG